MLFIVHDRYVYCPLGCRIVIQCRILIFDNSEKEEKRTQNKDWDKYVFFFLYRRVSISINLVNSNLYGRCVHKKQPEGMLLIVHGKCV